MALLTHKTQNMRLEFAQKFMLYSGLVYYITKNKDRGLAEANACSITSQSIEKYEQDLMKIWNCDPKWPVCLYDFSFKNKNPTYLAFRVEKDLSSYIKPGYFYGQNTHLQPETAP